MFLTGYHGTNIENAHTIITTGKYKLSVGEKEWLGHGIYFYFKFEDAYDWNNSEVILHSVIKMEDFEFLDMESAEGEDTYRKAEDRICAIMGGKPPKTPQKNQCALMNIIWDVRPELQAIAAEFAKEPKKVSTLMDKRPRRKEFCIRNNEPIKFTHMIRKEDVE